MTSSNSRRSEDSRYGSISISGSGRLVRGLLADGLLDEPPLFVFPIPLGTSDRLFADQQTRLQLEGSHVYDNGVVHLCLTPRFGGLAPLTVSRPARLAMTGAS
jgi:dihydrofolate reductase